MFDGWFVFSVYGIKKMHNDYNLQARCGSETRILGSFCQSGARRAFQQRAD